MNRTYCDRCDAIKTAAEPGWDRLAIDRVSEDFEEHYSIDLRPVCVDAVLEWVHNPAPLRRNRHHDGADQAEVGAVPEAER